MCCSAARPSSVSRNSTPPVVEGVTPPRQSRVRPISAPVQKQQSTTEKGGSTRNLRYGMVTPKTVERIVYSPTERVSRERRVFGAALSPESRRCYVRNSQLPHSARKLGESVKSQLHAYNLVSPRVPSRRVLRKQQLQSPRQRQSADMFSPASNQKAFLKGENRRRARCIM